MMGGWLAHLGGLRLGDQPKESREAMLAGARTLFVEFVEGLGSRWRPAFDEARDAASNPTPLDWPRVE